MKKISNLIDKIRLGFASKKGTVRYFRSKGMKIGSNCDINKSLNVISEPYLVTLGDNVRITSGVKMITHDGGVIVARRMEEIKSICPDIEKADIFGRITVGNNVHIGVDAIIMPGVTIGSNCLIGAGAVVVHDIPDNSVAVGVPARVIKTIEQYVRDNMDDMVFIKHLSYEEKREYLENRNRRDR